MSPVDVDLTTIPDMIEAQLTLSYGRLSNLVRLIIDQGNGHDVDIDKLSSRVDALKEENAELRSLVKSLLVEKSHDKDVEARLDELHREVSRVFDACAENSRQLVSVVEENQERFNSLDRQLKKELKAYANEVEQIDTSIKDIQRFASGLEGTLNFLHSFVVLWEGSKERVEALVTRDTDGKFQCSTEERVDYLHSLPSFVKLWEEMDVLRQMIRQQASETLSAKRVAGALRRASSAEAAAVASATHALDHDLTDSLRNSLDAIEQRVKELEKGRISFSDPANGKFQKHQQGNYLDEREGAIQLDSRLREVEDRLRNLSVMASDGDGMDKTVMMNIERRLQVLEGVVNDLSLLTEGRQLKHGGGEAQPAVLTKEPSYLQSQPQRPASAIPTRRASTQMGKANCFLSAEEGGASLPQMSTLASNGKGGSSSARVAQQSVDGASLALQGSARSLVDPSNLETDRRQFLTLPPASNSRSQVQLSTSDGDGFLRRIARLEEGLANLEIRKADRQELAAVEASFRQLLQNPTSYMSYGLMPHRPMSQNDIRAYTEVGAMQGNSSVVLPRSASAARPLFVGASSHNLRDTSGAMTPATVSPSHPS